MNGYRRTFCLLLSLFIFCGVAPSVLAEAPSLSAVFADDSVLVVGTPLSISFEANVAGKLELSAAHRGEDISEELPSIQVAAGPGSLAWDGTVNGQPVAPGEWAIQLTLVDEGGARSQVHTTIVEVQTGDGAQDAPAADESTQQVFEPTADRQLSPYPDPHELCSWGLDIDHMDIYDPEDQAKIWEVLMQPVTVLDVGPKEHVYPLISPDADPKDVHNLTGQLHGQTCAVHVLETLDNGWTLIEAFSTDGYGGPPGDVDFHDFDNKLIQGYVKTRLLKTVKPYAKYGIVIDKLTQRMHIFEDGALFTTLLVSTGFPTASQPWNETPSGEYLVDTWVGKFVNGNMMCDLALRINGGCLLHEVPHKEMADGTRNYTPFEPYLGQKASHGCVRIQRMRNNDGVNMAWLWNNLKRNTKVLIWDDAGRATLPVPEWSLTVYYNPDGGKSYHREENCSAVKERFLPLSPLAYEDLYKEPTNQLIPCYGCLPFYRAPDPSAAIPDDILGAEQTDY